MKKLILSLFSLILAFSFTSCDVEDEVNNLLGDLLNFEFDLNESFSIPSIEVGAPQVELNPAQRTNQFISIENEYKSFLDENNLSSENVESISLSALKLTTTDNFNAIESVTVSANNTVIATLNPVPADAQEITLEVNSNQDLKDILSQDEITLDIELFVKEVITNGLDANLESTFEVQGRVTL